MQDVYQMPGHLIRRMHQISVATFMERAGAAGIDLTPVQYAALNAIGDNEALDQATLAALIAYDRVTIGGVVDRLVAKGLVKRRTSRRDRRARELFLTDEGRDVFDRATPVVRDIQDAMLGQLSAEERAGLVGLLQKATRSGADAAIPRPAGSRGAPR